MWQATQRVLCVFRAALGSGYVVWSARTAGADRGLAAPGTAVAGILGIRHIAQALLTADRPTRAVLVLGAEADAAHAASMAVTGAVSARWRRYALADALIATSLAAAGLACARTAPATDPAAGRLLARRDRLACRLAPAEWLSR